MIETLETLMHERVKQNKKFIPIYIDDSLFDDNFLFEVVDDIDMHLERLKQLTNKATDRNLDTSPYDTKRRRLINLRNNLPQIIDKLNKMLVADFSTEKTFEENLPKLIRHISDARLSHVGKSLDTAKSRINQASSSVKQLSSWRKRTLSKRLEGLQSEWELREELYRRLREAYSLTDEYEVKRQKRLEMQIKEQEEAFEKLGRELDEIERELG